MTTSQLEKKSGQSTRILIIEDNSDDSALLMRQLAKANMAQHVRIFEDGKVAWHFLANEAGADLVAIFLDLKLPAMSGLQLLEKIRGHARLKDLPVIVMTSSNSPADLKTCQKLGVSSYVQKPVMINAFSKAVADNFHLHLTQTGSLRVE